MKVLLALALLSAASVATSGSPTTPAGELPKPSYARTMLKVSRSLPGETEELKIRTSKGNLATLIVKRREKSVSSGLSQVSTTTTKSVEPITTTTTTTTSSPVSSSTDYKNVNIDPWSRLQTWSSVSDNSNEESKSWVPVSRSFDSWKPVEQPATTQWRSFQSQPADQGDEQIVRYAFLPHEPPKRTNIGANLMKNRDAKNVPAEIIIRSELNVKSQPSLQSKRLTIDPDGTPVVHGRRVPDEPIDKIQVWRNARVINDHLVTETTTSTRELIATEQQNFERFFEDVNKRYGKAPDDKSEAAKSYHNEVLAAEIYESAEESYRPSSRKRMLQPELPANYPNSRMYTPSDSPVPSVKPGTRAPVLQYAHPELGVQPAKIVKNDKKKHNEEALMKNEGTMRHHQYQNTYQTPGHHNGEYRQKKKYVLNDKNIVDSYTNYKNYYPANQFYGLKRPIVEPPLWIRISENIKSGFSDGVAKVSEYTKPVIDPLVEATRKISENLGLSNPRSQDSAQDKVGTVASTGTSVLIPALGLMASGAALGIGAVAVGRYLDVDVLKRSSDGTVQVIDGEEKARALNIIRQLEQDNRVPTGERQYNVGDDIYVLMQQNSARDNAARRKRSVTDERQMQRKGADQIAEIVEIDLPLRSVNDTTNDKGNDVQIQNEDDFAKAIVRHTFEAITKSEQIKSQLTENKESETRTRRRKRSLSDTELEDALQNLENAEIAEVSHIPGDWTNTPCAKRIFCDAMVKRGSDVYMFMEKKMSGLLRMIQPVAAVQVSSHFDEVMEAVRRHDCSVFSCPQARPANVFF
ncbi:uncharacterized protein LOC131674216 [Phymastichus coffea]|uniref:uncharacterized protein LOC131674216 n=1 Tax=Phymastichus coffea TaxID=108790 RepID=UPI00273BD94D|nr:uncharacterized protein LOC131674216 [Phymastichus coffea]